MSKPELSDIAIELACIGIDALIFGVIYKINKTHKNNIEAIKVSSIRFHEIFTHVIYDFVLYILGISLN